MVDRHPSPQPEVEAVDDVLGRLKPDVLVSVANRPVIHISEVDEGLDLRRPPGGLGPSMAKALRSSEAVVYATARSEYEQELGRAKLVLSLGDGLWMRYVTVPEERFHLFYNRIASLLLYLVHHDLAALLPMTEREKAQEGSPERLAAAWQRVDSEHATYDVFNPGFRRAWAQGYRWVNAHYAGTMMSEIGRLKAPRILINDCHFSLLPRLLRERGCRSPISLFFHIPWPEPDAFSTALPREVLHELIAGCLGSDAVGFHVEEYRQNFLQTIEAVRGVPGRQERDRWVREAGPPGSVQTFTAPISVHPELLVNELFSPTALRFLQRLRDDLGDRLLLVRAERIDPIKGLLEGLDALSRLFERRPDLSDRVRMLALLQPSRTQVPLYRELRKLIHQRTREIADRFSDNGWHGIVRNADDRERLFARRWPPVVLHEAPKPFAEVLGAMAAADIGLFNSLVDGMNLSVKEFLVVNEPATIRRLRRRLKERGEKVHLESGGALVSKRTGAAQEIAEFTATIDDPRDTEETSRVIEWEIDRLLTRRDGNASRAEGGAAKVRSWTIDDWTERILSMFPRAEVRHLS